MAIIFKSHEFLFCKINPLQKDVNKLQLKRINCTNSYDTDNTKGGK